MDILIHTASGMLVGSTMATWNPMKLESTKLLWAGSLALGGLAGAFPDIDALSAWSGFDRSIGAWFHLPPGDTVYSGRLWYSHHAFTHSLLASVLFASFAWVVARLIAKGQTHVKAKSWYFFAVVLLGWNAHLAGDLPTPQGPWQGIAYFWPSPHYIGGTGQTFWWNNYDIFLLLMLGLGIQLGIRLLPQIMQRIIAPWFTLCILIGIVYQLYQRPIDFNDKSRPYAQREQISLDYQRSILGERCFRWMQKLDAKLPVYF